MKNISFPPGKILTLKDGRQVGYAEYGDPGGFPVFGFHGLPGTRLMMKVWDSIAQAAGARLIAPDRPGYGLSSPHPKGNLATYPLDIAEMADAMSLERFSVAGVSGGGPFALACAHELPERLMAAAVVSGIGPLSQPGSMRDMIAPNRLMLGLGRISPGIAGQLLTLMIRSSLPSMEKQAQNGTSPSPDISPEAFAVIAADQKEVVRTGGKGIAFDMKAIWKPWGFRFEDIQTKVYLWHGEADNLAPASLAHYIAGCIPGCEATFYPGEGHADTLIKHGSEVLTKII
ncbi:MAG: alpha/beta fold hydrolase [Omnitrophica WOR_2 bacterium]